MAEHTAYVDLICVKERSKLRVRITTPGYLSTANCMFPRNLRTPGARFRTTARNVRLVTSCAKWFYSVGKRDPIECITASVAVIFEDETTNECAICLENQKTVVVNPCGHYYMCADCASRIGGMCPVCRGEIISLIDRSQIA